MHPDHALRPQDVCLQRSGTQDEDAAPVTYRRLWKSLETSSLVVQFCMLCAELRMLGIHNPGFLALVLRVIATPYGEHCVAVAINDLTQFTMPCIK